MTGLAERLESIERRVFGDYADSYANPDLTNRLAALQSKLDEVEKSIPDHQFCKANTCKYNIYLRDKRVTSLQVSDRAEYLAATRFEIEKNLNYMAIIQSASAVLDEDYFTALLKSISSRLIASSLTAFSDVTLMFCMMKVILRLSIKPLLLKKS